MDAVTWDCRGRVFAFPGRALVLGVLNVTPDSFSDGGTDPGPAAAVARGLAMLADGADILDIGGESTRPGASPVSAAEQLRRIGPVVRGVLAEQPDAVISIDTTSSEVARDCLAAGARVINDVSGLRADSDMPAVVAASGAGVIVMHMQGTPRTMQVGPAYSDVTAEVGAFFADRLAALAAAGVRPDQIALDPGVGFGKTLAHNLVLLRDLRAFQAYRRPVCLGASRKGFIGTVTGRAVGDRLAGSVAVAAFALAVGSAQILRVHDVAATVDAVKLDGVIHGYC